MNPTNAMSTISPVQLEPLSKAEIANLILVTQDPIDAMRLAADLYAFRAYAAEQHLAYKTGAPRPHPPNTLSEFLRGFLLHLKGWIETMAHTLRPDDIQRLKRIGDSLVTRLKEDPGLLLEEL